MPPRRSPPRRLWVDQLNAYTTVAICSENQGPVSQRVPTKAIADQAFGLQNGCSVGVSRVMPGMQEAAAEKTDAGLRKALAG